MCQKQQRTRRGESPKAQRRALIIERRRTIRKAFDLIRYDPNQRPIVDLLAGTLGGRYPMSEATIEKAQRIIDDAA